MKVFMTGGAGYLGYAVCKALEQNEKVSEVCVYDNLSRKNLNGFLFGDTLSKTQFVYGDLINEYKLKEAAQGSDVVIHLAAYVDFPFSYKDNYRYEQINQFGTNILINVLRETKPEHLIYASSGAVYGFQVDADEETPPKPDNAYGKSKYQGEKYVELLRKDCRVQILRIANIFGFNPLFRYDTVINRFIFDSLLYRKIKIIGSGEQKRPFIHVDEVTKYIGSAVKGENKEALINLVQGFATPNEIKDRLLQLNEELEFSHLHPGHTMNGYTMQSKYFQATEDLASSFTKCYEDFRRKFKLL